VNHSVRLEAGDACGLLQLTGYSARAPFSLERLQYDARKQQVTLQSDKREGPVSGTSPTPAPCQRLPLRRMRPDRPAGTLLLRSLADLASIP
jgi:hypothetical protein